MQKREKTALILGLVEVFLLTCICVLFFTLAFTIARESLPIRDEYGELLGWDAHAGAPDKNALLSGGVTVALTAIVLCLSVFNAKRKKWASVLLLIVSILTLGLLFLTLAASIIMLKKEKKAVLASEISKPELEIRNEEIQPEEEVAEENAAALAEDAVMDEPEGFVLEPAKRIRLPKRPPRPRFSFGKGSLAFAIVFTVLSFCSIGAIVAGGVLVHTQLVWLLPAGIAALFLFGFLAHCLLVGRREEGKAAIAFYYLSIAQYWTVIGVALVVFYAAICIIPILFEMAKFVITSFIGLLSDHFHTSESSQSRKKSYTVTSSMGTTQTVYTYDGVTFYDKAGSYVGYSDDGGKTLKTE